jgi:hypothetical protein
MKKMIPIIAVILSILLAVAFTGGCKKSLAERITEEAIERAIEEESGEEVDIDLEEGEVTIKSDEGEVKISTDEETVEIESDEGSASFGTGADLPDDFPGIVPIYDNMEITASWSQTDEDGISSWTVSGETQDSLDDIKAWYESQLSGWEITGEFTIESDDGETTSINAMTDDYELSLMITQDEDGTYVFVGVSEL